MQNLLNDLAELLKTDERLVTEGRLVKNKIIELALQTDADLLKMLLKNDTIKAHFFTDVDGILVFDKIKFMRFVANKQFLPDSYTAYKNKVGLIKVGDYYDDYLTKRNDVVLAWPYKDTVLQGGQTKEDDRRNEVFWNETLAPDQIDRLLYPKVLTNWKKYSTDGMHSVSPDEPINFNKENLIIKGNNLLALHSLKQRYAGKVKLIYIDPPYNTGNDSFMYNDSFNHSTWLTFMKNRLTVARELLKKDGVLYIHIDEKEIGYLTTLTDEIFDRSNYLNTIVVKTSDPSGHKVVNPSPYSQTEFVLMYAKNKQAYKYDIQYVETNYDPMYNKLVLNIEDDFSKWQFSTVSDEIAKTNGFQTVKEAKDKFGADKFFKLMAEFALKNKNRVFQATAISNKAGKDIVSLREQSKLERDIVFHYPREGYEDIYILNGRQMYFYSSKVKLIYGKETPAKPLTNLWSDIPYNGIASEGNVSMKNGKKPEKLLQRIIEISTNKNDIVMDFFAGSGTTAAIAHKMNRKYIAIEQLDYIEDLPLERLQNVIGKTVKPEGELHEKNEFDKSGITKAVNWQGGGSFVYCELMQYNQKYIDQIMQAENTETLLTIWEDMRENAFLNYLFNNKSFDKNIEDFKQLELEEQKKFLFELLDKNQLYLNYGEIEDENFTINETDKKLNNQFYKTR